MNRSQLGFLLLIFGIVMVVGPKVKTAVQTQSLSPFTMDGWASAGIAALGLGALLSFRSLRSGAGI